MAAKKGPTKPKVRRVLSDDCILTQDGVEYAIHAGEWVEFRGRPSMAFFTMYLSLQNLASDPTNLTPVETGAMAHVAEGIGDHLARHIAAWTWTDDAGAPLPLPTEGAALDNLDQVEFQWLLAHFLNSAGGDRPNASSPSTSL
jgi:hypothetical protein